MISSALNFLAPFLEINFLLTLFGITLLYWHFLPRFKNMRYHLPSGPIGIPFLGYHPFLGSHPEEQLEKLRNIHGNLFGMYIGSQYCLVISDFDTLKEAYNKEAFLGRPPLYFRTSPDHQNFGEMHDYRTWLDQRRFAINTLKTLGMGKGLNEEFIVEEITEFLVKMEVHVNESKVNLRDILTPSINNAILKLIFNKRLNDDDLFMKQLTLFVDLASESYLNTSPIFYYPWLRPFILKFSSKMKEITRNLKIMEDYVQEEIKTHQIEYDENNLNDYIDHYIYEMNKETTPSSFTVETLTNNSMFLLLAGSDTIRNTLEWCLLIMIKYPTIQEKVYQEILSIIGKDKRPEYSDKAILPYTEAVIMEVERWRTLTVLNCLRMTTTDTTLKDYQIPKGTYIINNIHACHMNPKEWDQPKIFNPDRFLSSDKTRIITPQNLLLFSYGKRDCPGDKMARMEVFMYFAALMQKFRFLDPEGGLSLESIIRVNAQSAYPIVRYELR